MKAVLTLLALCSAVHAAEPAAISPSRLLPDAMVANPTLNMTACTVVTPYGRDFFAPVADGQPVYCEVRDDGQKMLGHQLPGQKNPPTETIREAFLKALAANGYQPAPSGIRPKLLIVYYWGSHNGDRDLFWQFPELARQYFAERALLVGGEAFQAHVMEGSPIEGGRTKPWFLKDQASDDLNFVVVSAYDYDTHSLGEARRVWRTTLTVGARGVSLEDSLVPLILTGGDYFGREMPEPVGMRRPVRRGTVTMGPLEFVAVDDAPQPQASP